MAKIYNSEITKELIDGAKIQINTDKVPNELAEKVVPTFETNPKLLIPCNVLKNASKSTTGAATLYSVPSDRDFYLTSLHMSYTADATNDAVLYYIDGTIAGGSLLPILTLQKETTTAGNDKLVHNFVPPLKMERGSILRIVPVFTAGTTKLYGTLTGYTIDKG